MKKKIFSILLAGAMLSTVAVTGMVSASAEEESGLAPGSYCNNGKYTPTAGVITQHLMFAMPTAWQNDTWKADPNGSTAGLYWWTGYDTPDNKFGHGWPGYEAEKVSEGGITNLYAMDVPTYGNGEDGDGNMIIWNNYLDGGTETDPTKNPFREAAQQIKDTAAQYYSRYDKNDNYEKLFRYIYQYNVEKVMKDEGKDDMAAQVKALDLASDTFWLDLNRIAYKYLHETDEGYTDGDFDKLSNADKNIVVDEIIDDNELDVSMFGDYAGNFYNEDFVDEIYPKEVSNGHCIAFTFDNMVYVIDFDVSLMTLSPTSQKLGMGGDWYFYYGNGEYGTWPTKALNEEMGATTGNFTTGDYTTKTMEEIMKEYNELHKDDPTEPAATTTVPAAATDASSSTSDSSSGSSTNTSNGAVATGQVSLISVILIVLAAGIGVVVFTRKRSSHK